jgi:hypothetical protein
VVVHVLRKTRQLHHSLAFRARQQANGALALLPRPAKGFQHVQLGVPQSSELEVLTEAEQQVGQHEGTRLQPGEVILPKVGHDGQHDRDPSPAA